MNDNYLSRDRYGMYAGEHGGPGPTLMGSDTLLANQVFNREGEQLGTVREFMLDMATGQVTYAVLSFGGERLHAVPWAALALDTANRRFTLDMAKLALDDAPGFEQAQWPWMADDAWSGSVHRFYGTVAEAA
jgi:hypothetical protein